MAKKKSAPERRKKVERRKGQKLTLETLQTDLDACSNHVSRIEKAVNLLKAEVSHLREVVK